MENGIPSGDDIKMSRVIKRDLRNAEEINRLAMSGLKENYDKAKKYFALNVKRNPSYVTCNNLAWYYFKCEELNPFWYGLNSFKKSTKYCMKALQLNTNPSSMRLLRDILYAQKEFNKARDIQERIFECAEDIDDHYVMGCIYMGLKDYGAAEKYLKKVYDHYYSQKSFDDDYVFVTFALCLAKMGNFDKANIIGDYLLEVFGGESICLVNILMIYYYTSNFEKIKEYLEEFQRKWAIQEDILAIILLTNKHYYSKEEYEKKYIDIIERVKKGYNPGWRRKDLVPLEKVHEQINAGIKPEIKYEPLRYFISNYIKC